jgi:O-acetyl-ADP-ribose deacetylase (regulator of RNase III)
MLTVVEGDIWVDHADVLVIPTNTKGVAGAGMALAWKALFPLAAASYTRACRDRQIWPGDILWVMDGGRDFICAMTKGDWRQPSQELYVHHCLANIAQQVGSGGMEIAIPALGCGLGGLSFEQVQRLAIDAFQGTIHEVRLYRPQKAER